MNVAACFAQQVSYLSTGVRSSKNFLRQTQFVRSSMSYNGRRMLVPDDTHCVDYSVDVHQAQGVRQARQYGQSWLVNNQAWFWRPRQQGQLVLNFSFNSGTSGQISAPWKKAPETNRFFAGNTPNGWTSRMAFGHIHTQSIITANKHLQLGIVGIQSAKKRQEIRDWIDQASEAVTGLYGTFPVDQAQILVVAIGRRSEAVPWGEVQRAGSPAVHLFVDQTRPIQQFKQDWTAVHELSHLLLPRIHYQDRWLSEGVASYYQNVARANAEMLSPQQAWNKLNAGFNRGRKAQKGNLRRSRTTMHTYWGGAAFYLLADLRLRAKSNPTTLAQVLGKLRSCCMPSDKMWSAREFSEKMDELSESRIFSSLLENEAIKNSFPVQRDFSERADAQTQKNLNAIFQKNYDDDVTKD